MNTRATNIAYIIDMIAKLGAETVVGPLLDDLKLAALERLAATIAEPSGEEVSLDELDAMLNGSTSRPTLRQQVIGAVNLGKAETFLEGLTNPTLARLAMQLYAQHTDHIAVARQRLAGVLDPSRIQWALGVRDRNGHPFVTNTPRAEGQIRVLLATGRV